MITDAFGVPQPKEFLNLTVQGGTLEVYNPLVFQADQPIDSIVPGSIRLETMVDTLWEPIAIEPLTPDSLQPLLKRNLKLKWTPGAKYRVTVDTLAFTGIYGLWNKPLQQEFTIKSLDEYSNLTFNIEGLEPDSAGHTVPCVVELLGSDDKPVSRAPVVDGKAVFRNLAPSAYYARLIIDANGNGKWDTGNIAENLQPEEVYYYTKKLQLKKNWDVEQAWNIYEAAIDAQKPNAIKKNKPKPKKGEKVNNRDEDDIEYDEFGNPIDGNDRYDRNDPNNLRNRRPGASTGRGGLRTNGNTNLVR